MLTGWCFLLADGILCSKNTNTVNSSMKRVFVIRNSSRSREYSRVITFSKQSCYNVETTSYAFNWVVLIQNQESR